MSRSRVVFSSCLFVLAVPGVATANPLFVDVRPVPLFLAAEGFLIAYLAGRAGVRVLRFAAAWFAITALTFISMVVLLTSLEPRRVWLAVSTAESLVVVIEALAIRWLLSLDAFVTRPERRPTFVRALVWSVIANAASLGGSVVAATWPSWSQYLAR